MKHQPITAATHSFETLCCGNRSSPSTWAIQPARRYGGERVGEGTLVGEERAAVQQEAREVGQVAVPPEP